MCATHATQRTMRCDVVVDFVRLSLTHLKEPGTLRDKRGVQKRI